MGPVSPREYRTQIKKLAGKPINLAFVPMDPRQGADQELGMDYSLETTSAEYVFPMAGKKAKRQDFYTRRTPARTR